MQDQNRASQQHINELERLGHHDHACLIDESSGEVPTELVVSFLRVGLKRRERCLYIVEAYRADEVRSRLHKAKFDVAALEASRQLIFHESESYTRTLSFDPNRMIALLIGEVEKARNDGYRGLRVTDEMTWALPGRPGSQKVLEYEARLNRDFFARYPCLAMCQYHQSRLGPEIIKGALMTHPLVAVNDHIHDNPHYISPEEFMSERRAQREIEHWLQSFERDSANQRRLKAMQETVEELAQVFEARDHFSAGHQRRVAKLACAIAQEMDLPPQQIDLLGQAGILHDMGKIFVPTDILTKPGSLTTGELETVRFHPKASFDLLTRMAYPRPIPEIVLQHHERMDGSGYPRGLSGDYILLEARILAVADVVEAMSFARAYRQSKGVAEALQEISWNKGTLFDTEVVDACLRLFTEKSFRFE
jgi:HD-GYP domain-containing protein (c-di-GMP phosphodiesterase class II)